MVGEWNAWSWDSDPDTVRRSVALAHEHFTDSGRVDANVRAIVGESWKRSARYGVDPDTTMPRLELTGPGMRDHLASPQALALVRTVATAAELELRAFWRSGRPPRPRPSWGGHVVSNPWRSPFSAPFPRLLGRDRALLTLGGRETELSARHSEILLLISRHAPGLTGEALGALLHERDASPVTVRAEISRMRYLLGPDVLVSHPYRLRRPLRSDIDEVRGLLAGGVYERVLESYAEHVLPRSEAPGVLEVREELQSEMCSVQEACTDRNVQLHWAEHAAWGAAHAWGRTSVAERGVILNRLADRMEDNLEKLAVAESWEDGKPVRECLTADLPLAVDHFRYFAAVIRAQEGHGSEIDGDTVAYHFQEPLGVVGSHWRLPPDAGSSSAPA